MPVDATGINWRLAPPHENTVRHKLWPHVFLGLFGAGWAISFDLGVRVYGAEIVAAAGLLLVNWRPLLTRYSMLRAIILAYALWVVAIGLSDLINGTAIFDSLRHMATPTIGAASLIFALAMLSEEPSAFLTFLAATAVTKGLLGEAQYGDAFADQTLSWDSIQADTNFFKVRIEPFLTPTFLLIAFWIGRRSLMLSAALFIMVSIVYFAVDARSSGLVFFLSALTLAGIRLGWFESKKQLAVAAIVAGIVAYGGYLGYVEFTLSHSPDGHNGKQLQRLENPYNPIELLSQGRSEWLVMPAVIAERPLFGWGSWAEDTDLRFAYMRIDRTGADNYGSISGVTNRIYLPAHSLIGAAWVWSGLLGFVALAWFLRSVLLMSLRLPGINSSMQPLALFMVVLLLWHYFFSPPQMVRLFFPTAVALLIGLTSSREPRSSWRL